MRAAAVAVVVLFAAPAFAQAPGEVTVQPPPPAPTGLDARRDAVAETRGLVGSTALTVPEGRAEVTVQAIVPYAGILGVNVGLTKTTELWVDGAASFDPHGEGESEHAYGIGIKQVLVKSKQVAFAVTGSVRKAEGFGGSEGWTSLGVVGTLCADDHCGLMVSGAVQRLFSYRDDTWYGDDGYTTDDQDVTMVTLSASVGGATTRFLVDLVSLDRDKVGFLGLRFGNKLAAVDLAIAKAIGEDDGETIPWVGVTGRM